MLQFQLFLFCSTLTIGIGMVPLPSHISPVLPWTRLFCLNPSSQFITYVINLPRGQVCWFPENLTEICYSTSFPLTFASLKYPRVLAPNFQGISPTYPDSFPLLFPEAYLNATCSLPRNVHLISTLLILDMTQVWKPFTTYSDDCHLLPQNVPNHLQSSMVITLRSEENRKDALVGMISDCKYLSLHENLTIL